MANSADDYANMHCVTTATAAGDLFLGVAEERADFIRAVSVGLNDLEGGLAISFDDAAIRLGLNRNELPSRPNEREENL